MIIRLPISVLVLAAIAAVIGFAMHHRAQLDAIAQQRELQRFLATNAVLVLPPDSTLILLPGKGSGENAPGRTGMRLRPEARFFVPERCNALQCAGIAGAFAPLQMRNQPKRVEAWR